MANKFKVWIDVANNNILSEADYAEDAQRTNGFTTGTVASSKRVNSALRSSSLVTAALMGLVDNDNLDLTSTLADVQQALASYFTRIGSVTPDASVADNIVKFNVGNSTYNKTINNVANVTDSLNNVPLIGTNGIFESDGKKAKNATQADNATNATQAGKITYTNVVPTQDNTSGTLMIYIGPTIPSTYYNNILYIITTA